MKLGLGEAGVSEEVKMGLEVGREVLWRAFAVLSFIAVRCNSCIFLCASISLPERVSSLKLSVFEANSHCVLKAFKLGSVLLCLLRIE